MPELKDLIGKIMVKVAHIVEARGHKILFVTHDGERYKLWHNLDCCESVVVEDITGRLEDLVGAPITLAEERTNKFNPDGVFIEYQGSFTWTFYTFATTKGHVDIRWYGESNGCYSEGVDFDFDDE